MAADNPHAATPLPVCRTRLTAMTRSMSRVLRDCALQFIAIEPVSTWQFQPD
jgi:hypothetical protein